MESMKISKKTVENVMNTLRFHRQNTVVRVRYSEREILSDNRCQDQLVELEDQRNNCQVCFSNTSSIMEHRIQGGFAENHKLGMLPEKKKRVLKIITLMDANRGTLSCRYCNHIQIDLRKRNKLTDEEYDHISNHGYLTGENPTVQEVLYKNGKNTLLVCLECEEIFPSYISLVLHNLYYKEHSGLYQEIYCPLCRKFETRTTLSAHLLKVHTGQVKCLMCPAVFPQVLDMTTHLTQPVPHPVISTEIRLLLTEQQVSILYEYRKQNRTMYQSPEETMIPVIRDQEMIEYGRYLSQPELLQNHQAEQNSQDRRHPRNCQDILAKFSHRNLSLQLSNVLQSVKLQSSYIISRETLQKMMYETKQAAVAIVIEKHCNQLVELPIALEVKQYGLENVHDHQLGHLLQPSILVQSESTLSASDLRIYDCLIIGNHGMKSSGTLPGASFRTLNLSPRASFIWPNYFVSLEHWNQSVQGSLVLDETHTVIVPTTKNYLLHVRNILHRIHTDKPTFVEFNLQGFLYQIPPETWHQFLEKNLKTLTLAYFIGLERIRKELGRTREQFPSLTVIGQGPISGILQMSARDMNLITEKIDQAGLLISRLMRVNYIPVSSLVGYGSRAHGNILEKPQPPLDLNHQWTSYARHQVLQLIKDYMAAKEDILNRAHITE